MIEVHFLCSDDLQYVFPVYELYRTGLQFFFHITSLPYLDVTERPLGIKIWTIVPRGLKKKSYLSWIFTNFIRTEKATLVGFSLLVHLINDVIFSILEDRSARHYCCVYMLCGTLSFFYLAIFNLGGSSIPTWILYNHPKDMLPAF
jgi:hypothetical protein